MIALSTFLHVGILIVALAIELSPKVQTGFVSKCALFSVAVFSLVQINRPPTRPPTVEGFFLTSALFALLAWVLLESLADDGKRTRSFRSDGFKAISSHKKDTPRFTRYG